MKTATKIALVLGGVIIAVVFLRRSPAPAPQPVVVQLPAPPQTPVVPVSPPKPTPAVVSPIVATKPAPPPAPVLPPLPQEQVTDSTEHSVPPSPIVKDTSRPLDLRDEDLPIPDTSPSYQSLAPEYRPIPEAAAAPPRPSYFSGSARVAGPTSLLVGGVPVELYGIARPKPGDRCEPADCVTAAEQTLEARTADNATISCHLARRSLGVVVFATCLDAQGTDLGGVLVGEGLARANARESYNYLGAEHIARDLRKGMWSGQ